MGKNAKRRPLVFDDEFYEGQLERTLATAGAGLCDLGEAVSTARSIGNPSPDRWFEAWCARAPARTAGSRRGAPARRRPAVSPRPRGDRAGTRSAYLRASEYYRQAYFFLRHDPADERLLAAYGKHVETFRMAVTLLDAHVEQLAIPFGDTTLSGYFVAPDDSGRPRPTVLFPCGYDSTAEEGYQYVPAALDRGFNAVVFEGPGQGGALYLQKLVFPPDFEVVVTPLVDLLTAATCARTRSCSSDTPSPVTSRRARPRSSTASPVWSSTRPNRTWARACRAGSQAGSPSPSSLCRCA
jgi:hypothetical protein